MAGTSSGVIWGETEKSSVILRRSMWPSLKAWPTYARESHARSMPRASCRACAPTLCRPNHHMRERPAMSELPGIVITGASGRMGQMLIRTVSDSPRARLIGAVERPGHRWIGQDVGTAMGGAELGVTVSDDPLELVAGAHAVIDFTAPDATVEMATLTAQARVVHVIGTTGFDDSHLKKLEV